MDSFIKGYEGYGRSNGIELIEFIWKFQIQQIQAEFFGEDSSCLAPNLRAAAVDEELQPFKYPQWANMNG
jgi:hypothetical protein